MGVLDKRKREPLTEEESKATEAIFFTVLAMGSLLIGFGTTIVAAKKRDPTMFAKGLFPKMYTPLPNQKKWIETDAPIEGSGGQLAIRALGWGTLYAFTGFGAFCYGSWKLIGAKDMEEFKQKVGSFLPVIPKNNPPQGRTEFDSLTDLIQYVIDEDQRLKKEKDTKS